MFLMMEHNKSEYFKFLKGLNKYKCDFVCYCCCRFMIVDQLNELQSDLDLNENRRGDDKNASPHNTTHWETRDLSIQDYKIIATGNMKSIDTSIALESESK